MGRGSIHYSRTLQTICNFVIRKKTHTHNKTQACGCPSNQLGSCCTITTTIQKVNMT